MRFLAGTSRKVRYNGSVLPFTIDELDAAVADKTVKATPHPEAPYTIYTYAKNTQYKNNWNKVTLNCRGLILDPENNIIARPWPKFGNLGDIELPIQTTDPVEVTDKIDGSMGILYPMPDRTMRIATKARFDSPQADAATRIWKQKYAHAYDTAAASMSEYTFIFEIVHPDTKIVVNYDYEDLVLLGATNKQHGWCYGPREAAAMLGWEGPTTPVYDNITSISDALGAMGRPNKEGYVARSGNFLVKIKEPEYIDVHRLVTNANPKTVWESLYAGDTRDQIVSRFPDELYGFIEKLVDPLLEQFNNRVEEIIGNYRKVLDTVGPEASRKKIANTVRSDPDRHYYFRLLDGDTITETVWEEIKPAGNSSRADIVYQTRLDNHRKKNR